MTKSAVNSQLTYEVVVDLLPGYTLGVLEADEMLAVDEYLRHHQELLTQLQRSDETVAHFARNAPAVTPSPEVKDALMSRVYSALSDEPTIELKIPPQQAPAVAPSPAPMTWMDQLRYELGGGLTWPTSTALAVLACLLLAILSVQMWRNQRIAFARLDTAQQTLELLNTQSSQLQSANMELNRQLLERNAQVELFAAAMRGIALEGTEYAPQASGALYTSRPTGVLILNGLAPLPEEQTYQLWLIRSEEDPVSLGLIQVDADGTTFSQVSMDGKPQTFAAVGLSIEPAGGSTQPTGPIVLLGTVSS